MRRVKNSISWDVAGGSRLLRLTTTYLVELEVDLRAWGRDHALCRAVAAIHPNP
jgi:hypothetical protein